MQLAAQDLESSRLQKLKVNQAKDDKELQRETAQRQEKGAEGFMLGLRRDMMTQLAGSGGGAAEVIGRNKFYSQRETSDSLE